jgi:hypothetical protein
VATEREYALAVLTSIEVALRDALGPYAFDTLPGAPDDGKRYPLRVRLSTGEMNYLLRACMRAAAQHHDPLGLGKSAGGQHDGGHLLLEGKKVYALVQRGSTIRSACETVGEQVGKDGSKGGSVEKNYKRHRPQLEAGARFYADRNAGRDIDPADLKAMRGGKAGGNGR